MEFTRQNIGLMWSIYLAGFCYTALILPGLIYRALSHRTGGRQRLLIVVGVMLVIWMLLNVIRYRTFLLRMLYQDTLDPQNTNDGQAGDFVLFALGWLPPVLSMMCADLVAWAFKRLSFRPANAVRT
jgi:hypothetical protein